MAGPKRILVVEDEKDMNALFRDFLAALGYQVTTAHDGAEALELAKKDPPDLILLDIMLPSLDGYHVALEVSRFLGARAPKILVVTCRNVERERQVALMSGASAVLEKPVALPALQAAVERLLTDRQTPAG